jgi:hypothetical protein
MQGIGRRMSRSHIQRSGSVPVEDVFGEIRKMVGKAIDNQDTKTLSFARSNLRSMVADLKKEGASKKYIKAFETLMKELSALDEAIKAYSQAENTMDMISEQVDTHMNFILWKRIRNDA